MDDLDHLLHKRAMSVPQPLAVTDALMARILADAAREQPRFAGIARAEATPPPMSLWAIITDLFGGGGVLAGLATAACAGVYLGAVQPTALGDLTLAWAGSASVDQLEFMPSIDDVLAGE